MLRREESETAEPQKESFREESCGQPRERTSVAVSERAQQKDWGCQHSCNEIETKKGGELTKSSSLSPLAALVKYTIALSVR